MIELNALQHPLILGLPLGDPTRSPNCTGTSAMFSLQFCVSFRFRLTLGGLGCPALVLLPDCKSTEDVLEILLNKNLIEINQDLLGVPAKPLTTSRQNGGQLDYTNVCVVDNNGIGSGYMYDSRSVLLWSGPVRLYTTT
jgi:hypothetical protein